jgi:hypothetical protein
MALSTDGDIEPQWIENALKLANDVGLDEQGALPTAEEIYTRDFVPVSLDADE